MSRLDYHSILDPNTSVDVDVDAEFDNPTILNHHDSENQNVEDGVDVHSHPHGIAVGIMDDEHDDTPFVIMEEHAVDPDSELAQGTAQETAQGQEEIHDDIQIPILSEEIVAGPDEPKGSGRGHGHGPMSLKGMSEEEKKQRQRLQNKLAAERSRNKRKGDQMNLEKQVDSLRSENAQLRARLTQLSSSSKSPEFNIPTMISDPTPSQYSPIPTTSSTTTTVLNGTGIDYNYISKLTNELNQSKMTLLERKIKLLNIQNGTYSSPTPSSEQKDKDKEGELGEGPGIEFDPIKQSRKELINKYSKLQSIKAEEKSLNTLIDHIKNEIENLIKQRMVVEEKLNEKRNKGSGGNDITMGNGDQDQVADTQKQQQQQQSVENPSTSIGDHTILVEDSQQPQQQDQIAEEQNQNQNQEAEDQDQDQDQDQMNEDGNLDDIRGWIDAAVKDWDQT